MNIEIPLFKFQVKIKRKQNCQGQTQSINLILWKSKHMNDFFKLTLKAQLNKRLIIILKY